MEIQPVRILLLDSHPDDRVMLTRVLHQEFTDLQVKQIASAESLGRALEAGDFDLVITDYRLRWTDGLAVLRAVKAAWPDRPVIMFTSTGSEEAAVEAMKAGLDDYLIKSPQHFDRLPGAIRSALEQARQRRALREAEQQQSRRLTLLADVSRIVATTLDVDALLQGVAESIHRHFAYPMVGLFTLDHKGQTLVLRGYSGVPIGPPELTTPGVYRQPIEQGIIGYVARTGEPYLAPDATIDPYHRPPQVVIRSEVCVPILEAGHLVGVVDVESDQLADFGEEDRSLLKAVADTVSIGLRNARLYEESQHRLRELTLLNRISVGLGTALSLDALINGALEGLHELVNADRTYFIAVDPDARTWERGHERVAPDVKLGAGLTGTFNDMPVELETLLAGQPFAVFDVTTDSRVEATREMYRSLGTRSLVLVPVQLGKRLYGALGFDYCREKHAVHPDEIRLLEGVAHQLELVLDNVHLFEEVRLRADELAAALARLEELDRLKDKFIQNVSHELRSPLAIIRGYVEMLEAGELGELRPEQRKPVAIIARRVRALDDLVQDITLILEAQVSPPEREAVPLGQVARTAAEDYQLVVRQAELTLQAEIAPHLPPVNGSYGYVRRVLDNLLDNAVKFTPAGGTITVRVRREGDQVVLEVSDTGVGIPSDQLDRIFERFYQVNGSIWRRYGGIGLGLALAKEIVETYGGRVTVESQVGEGSTFTVRLPIAADTDVSRA
jgi:signal transduction histidine kinase/DNA-binding NarL/FixJ family response regulator